MHYTENSQIELHELPSRDTIGQFLAGKHSGPSLDDLQFDFVRGLGSDWNKRAFCVLCKGFCKKMKTLDKVLPHNDQYYHKLIIDKFQRLAKIWRKAQPVTRMENGTKIMEDPAMVEARMNVDKEKMGKVKHHNTWHTNVSIWFWYLCLDADQSLQRYGRRLEIKRFMIWTSQDNCHIWEWLECLLLHLTPNGMSSKETKIGIDKKFHVKILVWCCSMDNYLELIDWQCLNGSGFSVVGSTPIRHLWYGRTTQSNQPAPTCLPEILYDPDWLESTDEGYHEVTLSVLRDKFEWLMFNSEDMEMVVWRWDDRWLGDHLMDFGKVVSIGCWMVDVQFDR